MKIGISICICVLILSVSFFGQSPQERVELRPRVAITATIEPGGTKEFVFHAEKGNYVGIEWLASDDLNLDSKLFSPTGKEITGFTFDDIAIVAPETGQYRFVISLGLTSLLDQNTMIRGGQRVTVQYLNTFVMPKSSVVKSVRKVNGYDVKIISLGLEGSSMLLVQKLGKLRLILKPEVMNDGIFFSDDLAHTYSPAERKSANLMKTTVDKTGDGTPDIAVEFYSGGAHCCYEMRIFELGPDVVPVEPLATLDARTIAIGKNPDGGLILETAETSFRYWNISFAGSPMPTVVLRFQNDRFKPDFERMKKPAPSLAEIQSRARLARSKMTRRPYSGYEFAGMLSLDEFLFEEAFWGEMLDLIYTGNESLAWQYFDLVWPADKPGKEIFRRDFEVQLSQSYFWRQIKLDVDKSNPADTNL